MKTYILGLCIPLLISCQDKFDGKSEANFLKSRTKIEQHLKLEEKINLEKAMRVVALEAMRLKFNQEQQYKDQSFNQISLSLVDGLSYNGIIDLAEQLLQKQNKLQIATLTQAIDSLTDLKNNMVSISNQLNLFTLQDQTIDSKEFFGKNVPRLVLTYQYKGDKPINGPITVQYDLYQKSNNKLINSIISTFGSESSTWSPDDEISETIMMSDTKESIPKLWNAPQYPIENVNLATYDLQLVMHVQQLTIDGKLIALPKGDIPSINAELETTKQKLALTKSGDHKLSSYTLTDL